MLVFANAIDPWPLVFNTKFLAALFSFQFAGWCVKNIDYHASHYVSGTWQTLQREHGKRKDERNKKVVENVPPTTPGIKTAFLFLGFPLSRG